LRKESKLSKSALAKRLDIPRTSLYYEPTLPEKDWKLKQRIEEVWRKHPAYGHRRLSLLLQENKKKILRVMRVFGMKPYRRRGRKYRQTKDFSTLYPNLIFSNIPIEENQIWASDFTYLPFKGGFVYLATVMDLWNRKVVGFSVLTTHSAQLTIQALLSVVSKYPPPQVIHSDQGREYISKDYRILCQNLGIQISLSHKGSPWENGYQESFYDKFKVELGDPNRFESLGELVYAIYRQIHYYNTERIHTILKMPPEVFSRRHSEKVEPIYS